MSTKRTPSEIPLVLGGTVKLLKTMTTTHLGSFLPVAEFCDLASLYEVLSVRLIAQKETRGLSENPLKTAL